MVVSAETFGGRDRAKRAGSERCCIVVYGASIMPRAVYASAPTCRRKKPQGAGGQRLAGDCRAPLGSGAPCAHHQAETSEAHYQQRQRSGLRRGGGGYDVEREVLVRASPPRPFVGAGRHAEAGEGGVVIGRHVRQRIAGDVARWHRINKSASIATLSPLPLLLIVPKPLPKLLGPLKPV